LLEILPKDANLEFIEKPYFSKMIVYFVILFATQDYRFEIDYVIYKNMFFKKRNISKYAYFLCLRNITNIISKD